jgi:hypothetical protein
LAQLSLALAALALSGCFHWVPSGSDLREKGAVVHVECGTRSTLANTMSDHPPRSQEKVVRVTAECGATHVE